MNGFNRKTVAGEFCNGETKFGEIIDQLKKFILRIRKFGAC